MRMPAQWEQIDCPYTYAVPPSAARPAMRAAFASACTTLGYFLPLFDKRSALSQTFFGNPLNPNATTLRSLSAMTVPTFVLWSFDHFDISLAMARYFRSQ